MNSDTNHIANESQKYENIVASSQIKIGNLKIDDLLYEITSLSIALEKKIIEEKDEEIIVQIKNDYNKKAERLIEQLQNTIKEQKQLIHQLKNEQNQNQQEINKLINKVEEKIVKSDKIINDITELTSNTTNSTKNKDSVECSIAKNSEKTFNFNDEKIKEMLEEQNKLHINFKSDFFKQIENFVINHKNDRHDDNTHDFYKKLFDENNFQLPIHGGLAIILAHIGKYGLAGLILTIGTSYLFHLLINNSYFSENKINDNNQEDNTMNYTDSEIQLYNEEVCSSSEGE